MSTVVIGAGYGDEGKGATVNSLASSDSLVCRFNGGSQAGHTVVHNGIRHIFSHFGAGTLKGAETYLSKFFVCNPSAFMVEYEVLRSKGADRMVTVSPLCPVTTLFDVVLNRIVESHRGDGRHGSVGVGFGETLERNQDSEFAFQVRDLDSHSLMQSKLRAIQKRWIPKRLGQLGISSVRCPEWYWVLNSADVSELIMRDFYHFSQLIRVEPDEYLTDKLDRTIFEGAQGLLLDQDYGEFPYVTRSNTGLKNVRALVGDTPLDIRYVTRAYTTRHGAGPLPFELKEKPYVGIRDETNITGEYQGSLRFSFLNLDETGGAIRKDRQYVLPTDKVSSVITCLDQVSSTRGSSFPCGVIYRGKTHALAIAELQKFVDSAWFS